MDYTARLSVNRFVIFLFHGVIERQTHKVRNYTKKHLLKSQFVNALKSLKTIGNAVSMDEILDAHRQGSALPPFSFAVTFDDGFHNNISVAAPILSDLRIPATFYVASDFIERNRMSWIDRIEWAVEQVDSARLQLPWGIARFADVQSKCSVLDTIRLQVKKDNAIAPDSIATEIQQQLGFDPVWSSMDPLDQKMTWDDVKRLANEFIVGGHTHNHAILSYLSGDDLEKEIKLPLSFIKRAGIETRHFSYPEGLAHCYSDFVIERLKAHSIAICPTAEDGDNDFGTDPFRLKRIMAL